MDEILPLAGVAPVLRSNERSELSELNENHTTVGVRTSKASRKKGRNGLVPFA